MILSINEHSEAYLALTYLFSKKIITNGNSLIHIDEHHDLGRAIVDKNMINNINNLEYQKEITYKQLRISDFILPLIYQNIIKKVYWINNEKTSKTINLKIDTESNNNNLILNMKKTVANDSKSFQLALLEVKDLKDNMPVFEDEKYIISIDLDYFSCDDEAGEYNKIEITKDSFYHNTDNVHSKWKMNFGSKIDFLSEGEKFYMTYQAIDGPTEMKIRDTSQIDEKLKQIEKLLYKMNINPELIIICKSDKSGYTPPESLEYIYLKVKMMLERIYGKEQKYYSEINHLMNNKPRSEEND